MRSIIVFTFLLALISTESTGQRRWKTIKPVTDTLLLCELLIEHNECTPCADAEIDSGTVRLPDSLLKREPKRYQFNIYFSNKEVFGKLFGDHTSKKFIYTYLVRGKVVGLVPPNKAHGHIPVFDVYQYKLVKKKRDDEPVEDQP